MSTERPVAPGIPSLDDVLNEWSQATGNPEGVLALKALLVAREDAISVALHFAGAQFGLFPQIVALVLADVGLGTPVSPEQHQFLHQQFTALMEQLHEQFGTDPGTAGPPV